MTVVQRRNYFTGILMHRGIYGNAPDCIKDSIQVFPKVIMFIQDVFALAIFMYHAQTVKYLNNHFYTAVHQCGIIYHTL